MNNSAASGGTLDRRIGEQMLRRLVSDDAAEFRPGQWEAIEAVLADKRVLLVQRTGWGKSAVYLIATRLLREQGRGPTVIVSPLLALMRNQVQMGAPLGIVMETVNSTNPSEWKPIFERIAARKVDLLLISPERLNNDIFVRDVLPNLVSDLGLLVIDEVHCISDWGHDFRPDYRRLSRIIQQLPPNVPVLGTTATANDRVVADIEEQLGANLVTLRGPLDRASLRLQAERLPNRASRMAWLAEAIPRLPGSGIVYCLTIRDTQRIARWLTHKGIDAVAYTGTTSDDERVEIEERLTAGTLKVVVATSALGMGYDNPHIQFVIHYQSPGSPVAYYQQVGRAGRAVDVAHGVLLSGHEDAEIQDYFITTAFPDPDDAAAVLDALASGEGMRIRDLEGVVNVQRGRIEAMLKILEVEGAVYRQEARWYRSANAWTYPLQRVADVTEERRQEQAAMRAYLGTTTCLMRYLREQLNDPEAEDCGRCANCSEAGVVVDLSSEAVQDAIAFLRSMPLTIPARRRWVASVDDAWAIPHPHREGRTLSLWGDPGWAELTKSGKYQAGRFDDELVDAVASLIGTWRPTPAPTWITAIPNEQGPGLVVELAQHLAGRLGLPYLPAVVKVRSTEPQKTMENSLQQMRNVLGAYEVDASQVRPDPVFLVDDLVDSRWTFAVVANALGAAGSGPVYPVALADTAGGGR